MTGAGIATKLEEIIENFEYLDEWEDRYRYLIELGRGLEPLDAAAYCDKNKVRGCASQVWLETKVASEQQGSPDPADRVVEGCPAEGRGRACPRPNEQCRRRKGRSEPGGSQADARNSCEARHAGLADGR